jgi:predicted CXXCH cytochrome family protein
VKLSKLPWPKALLCGVCLSLFGFGLFRASAQDAPKPDPHPSGSIVAPPGVNEVAYCTKCHTSGCPMPHVEHVPVTWAVQGRVNLANGQVTCSSCHTPGFKHRSDAFLARDQKGLCATCHYGQHVLPNAHPFGTPCQSCHTEPKASLVAGKPAVTAMVTGINGECLRCHYDGPITHPVGVKNSKKPAPELPLAHDGTITCVTCHVGHSEQNQNGQLLRKNNRRGALCLSCHDDL